jgi:hypothetical protein
MSRTYNLLLTTGMTVELSPETIDAIAHRVVELLQESSPQPNKLLTAAELARHFGVSRDWVYEHANELGVIRLGEGNRGRLRFDMQVAAEAISARTRTTTAQPTPTPKRRRGRPRKRPASSIPLIPYRGDDGKWVVSPGGEIPGG